MSEEIEVTGTAVAIIERDLTPMMVSDVKGAKARLAQLQEFVREVMVEGEDFGTLPGVKKPVLFKPGAEKLCEVYGFAQRIVVEHRIEQWEPPGFFHYEVRCELVSKRTGEVIGTGVGSCNSMEGRYRWRDSQRLCPECGVAAIIKGKEEYGGGFLCFAKKGGCGKKFTESDPAIIDQTLGKVENDDIYTIVNTLLKMAKKRAVVDATLSVTRSSGLFTQDEETLEAKAQPKATIKEPQRASKVRPVEEEEPPPIESENGERPATAPTNGERKISTKQASRFHAIASGANVAKVSASALLVAWGIPSGSANDIPAALYEEICASVAAGPGEVEAAITNLGNR